MRVTSTLTRMGAAAREQPRGASTVDSRTDEPRRRALHGQHSRANARETEQMSGDSPSGGAHFSMCTFDRAGCKDGSVLAAGGAAIRGSSGRSSEYCDRVPDRNSFVTNSSGRTFVMYHGTTRGLEQFSCAILCVFRATPRTGSLSEGGGAHESMLSSSLAAAYAVARAASAFPGVSRDVSAAAPAPWTSHRGGDVLDRGSPPREFSV